MCPTNVSPKDFDWSWKRLGDALFDANRELKVIVSDRDVLSIERKAILATT